MIRCCVAGRCDIIRIKFISIKLSKHILMFHCLIPLWQPTSSYSVNTSIRHFLTTRCVPKIVLSSSLQNNISAHGGILYSPYRVVSFVSWRLLLQFMLVVTPFRRLTCIAPKYFSQSKFCYSRVIVYFYILNL